MFQRLLFLGLFIFLSIATLQAGPYAPAAGQTGSTAISCDDPQFDEWATGISVVRGYQEIDKLSGGYASYGSPTDALGKATTSSTSHVVSLGDGGSATLTFDRPITNGSGYDFAVFENGMSDTFLELAFVEVSSDGKNFFRFPSVSLTQTNTQVGGFGTLDPTNLYDLAGNYRVGYGTPFDLSELGETPGLNVNAVTQVRIVDVVGCIQDAYCTYDSKGNKINDPWSTPFASSGFDLEGVGVIHAVPEPGTLALLASAGLISGFVFCRRRRLVGRHYDQPASAVDLPIYCTPTLHSTRSLQNMTYLTLVHHHWLGAQRATTAFLLVIGAIAGTSSATTVDFDDLSLASNSYWNGSDNLGGFTSRGVAFNNQYTDWGGGYTSWSGWAYSNVNNTTMVGSANQYAAYTGTDVSGSGNYAVGYVGNPDYGDVLPTITIPNGRKVQSAMFTNTTYAAISMLNGDDFSKQFGYTYNSDGSVKSSNDSDWFLLTITGKDSSGGTTGTVDFYLADYRNLDGKPDNIVNTWQSVDLSSLSAAKTLQFGLTSSDNSTYYGISYMNTPSYFAMDNLTVVPEPSTLVLLVAGSLVALAWRWRRRKQ